MFCYASCGIQSTASAHRLPRRPAPNRATQARRTVGTSRERCARPRRREPEGTSWPRSSPRAIARFARALFPDDGREHFWILLLDSRNHLVATHHVSSGTLTGTLVTARDVFGPALRVLGV